MNAAPAPDSSRQRLITAGRQLFSERGFENTSTATIAREAKSSESQLVKHFGSKEGLLQVIFEEGWGRMTPVFQSVEVISVPLEKLRMLLDLFLRAFEQDPILKELMLLESRRIRKEDRGIMQSQGYGQFVALVDGIFSSMAARGELRKGLPPEIVRAALMGMLEGMLREQVLTARHASTAVEISTDTIRGVFQLCLGAFLAEVPKAAKG